MIYNKHETLTVIVIEKRADFYRNVSPLSKVNNALQDILKRYVFYHKKHALVLLTGSMKNPKNMSCLSKHFAWQQSKIYYTELLVQKGNDTKYLRR